MPSVSSTSSTRGTERTNKTENRQPNKADQFLEMAMKFKNQPYLWGGGHGGTFSKPGPVDCSGLVQQAARMAGINLDGTAAVQQGKGKPVSMSDLKPGDLVFRGTPAHHVGIYIGNGMVLHAPKTGDVVRTVPASYFDSARRVFDDAGQPVDAGASAPLPAGGAPSTGGAGGASGGGGSAGGASGGGGSSGGGSMGGDSSGVSGGGRSSSLGMDDILRKQDEERKRREADRRAANGDKTATKAPMRKPAPSETSGLGNVNSTDVGNLGDVMAKLEGAGVDKEFLQELSQEYGVPLKMILAVIKQESGGDPNAKSPAGAQGLMQLMPATAQGLGVQNPMDPRQNVEGGVKYLAQQLRAFGGDTAKALAAYNAGPGNVQKYGGIPPFAETQTYVKNITASMGSDTSVA